MPSEKDTNWCHEEFNFFHISNAETKSKYNEYELLLDSRYFFILNVSKNDIDEVIPLNTPEQYEEWKKMISEGDKKVNYFCPSNTKESFYDLVKEIQTSITNLKKEFFFRLDEG